MTLIEIAALARRNNPQLQQQAMAEVERLVDLGIRHLTNEEQQAIVELAKAVETIMQGDIAAIQAALWLLAGEMMTRATTIIESMIPADNSQRPDWADVLLSELTGEDANVGPVRDRDDLARRARKAGLVIAG